MKVKNNQELEHQILNPKNLWIANTSICTIYSQNGKSRVTHSEKGRQDVAVVYTGDAFIELARIPNNLKISKCSFLGIEPVKEQEEYVNFETIKPFPYDEWFDFDNVTVESLKEMDTVRKIKKYLQQNRV